MFIHTTNAGNLIGNRTMLNYPGMLSSDILIVVHNYVGNFVGSIGVWWDTISNTWTILRQDSMAMPASEKFNVMVIKHNGVSSKQ